MTTAVVSVKQKREGLKAELARYEASFAALLPKGYDPSRLITGALLATQKNPAILDCIPATVASACAQVAQWGLDLGVTAHLVPFQTKGGKSVCTAVADYKGYIEQMTKAGARKVEPHEVREGDEFDYAFGTDAFLRHVPKAPDAAPITHAYAIVHLRGGVVQFEVMTAEQINEIRAKSQNWSRGPLTAWYARKTVVRRVAKYVPKTAQLSALMAGDGAVLELEPGEVASPERLAALEPERPRGLPMLAAGGYDPDTGEVTDPDLALDRKLAAAESGDPYMDDTPL